jgi:hypothetical protein
MFPITPFGVICLATSTLFFSWIFRPYIDVTNTKISCGRSIFRIHNYELWKDILNCRLRTGVVVMAYNEALFLTLFLANGWSMIYNPDIFKDNQILRMFKTNNPCVGWDMLPISFFACPAIAYLATLGMLLVLIICCKKHSTFFLVSSLYFFLSCLLLPNIFVVTPATNVYVHSSIFVNLIFSEMLMLVGLVLELEVNTINVWQGITFVIFSSSSTTMALHMLNTMAQTPENEPIPEHWDVFSTVIDLVWFVFFTLTILVVPLKEESTLSLKVE